MGNKTEKLIRQRQKYDYKDQWLSNDPIILKGEMCFEIGESEYQGEYSTYKLKIGDGKSKYSELPYISMDWSKLEW